MGSLFSTPRPRRVISEAGKNAPPAWYWEAVRAGRREGLLQSAQLDARIMCERGEDVLGVKWDDMRGIAIIVMRRSWAARNGVNVQKGKSDATE